MRNTLLQFYESLDPNSLVQDSTPEDLYLDYKEFPAEPNDARKILAVAISAFSNAQGGVLVWGIRCNKRNNDIPELRPIKDAGSAVERLRDWTNRATAPLNNGVLHRQINVKDQENTGFVASYIPESDAGPFMAKYGVDRYYKRIGSSALPMEHYEVADLFGRRRRPMLVPSVRIRNPNRGKDQPPLFDVQLTNTGRGIAKFPSLRLSFDPPGHIKYTSTGKTYPGDQEQYMRLNYALTKLEKSHTYCGGVDCVIHCGSTLPVVPIELSWQEGSPLEKIMLVYDAYADGMQPSIGAITIPCDARLREPFEAFPD